MFGKIAHALWLAAAGFCEYDVTEILRADARSPSPRGKTAVEAVLDPEEINGTHRALGHHISEHRIAQRTRRGLGFYRLSLDGQVVGSTWIVRDGPRFLDESGYLLEVSPDSAWIRDMFISPEARGKRVFGTFLDALASGPLAPLRTWWSDVNVENVKSIRAHEHYGFEPIGRVSAVHVAGQVMVRYAQGGVMPSRGFEAPRVLVHTGARFRDYKDEHLA